MKTFERTDVSMDWKKFGSIELKRLSEEIRTNSGVLNELGTYIGFCDIEKEIETQQIDQNFVKLFKCSQVLVEFLLSEFNRFKSHENESKGQNNLIRENKKLRKLLEIQQKAMTYSRTFNGENVQCPHCPKVFFDPIFLKTHLTRRHPNESLDSEGMMSLTNKIKDYQKVLIGDNLDLDKMKEEIQILTQKLTKTEADLVSEREERFKLEERIEYVMKKRDKEIQQTLREELEEFKFVQRERDIEKDIQILDNRADMASKKNDEHNPGSLEMYKIEEIIAIQAKEMIKLGNNVQKLVTHLTDSSEEHLEEILKIKASNKIKTKAKNYFEESKVSSNKGVVRMTKQIENKDSNKSLIKETEDFSQQNTIKTTENRKGIESNEITNAFNEVQRNLKEKLVSYGIDVNSSGISIEKYSDAIKKLNEERNLLIQQNRFDYDFNAVEQQIRKFVDKKVVERTGGSIPNNIEMGNPQIHSIQEIDSPNEEDISTGKQKLIQHSVEAIVHSLPEDLNKVLDYKSKALSEDIVSKSDRNENLDEKLVIREKSPKTVLKSIISDKKNSGNELKVKERRIRFSEHRIEHQLSPDESSDDTSEEYGPVVSDSTTYETNKTEITPIPAQRTRKMDLTLEIKTKQTEPTNDDSSDDNNYEIDDQLMSEILNTNAFMDEEDATDVQPIRAPNNSHHTKVQELTQMIEQQLNKRSAAHKKPPIGSVDIMTESKSKTTNSVLRMDPESYDSD